MKLHVPGLPWTETTSLYLSCAYTQKIVKFCRMMDSLGHEVILYGGERNEAPCAEFHPVVSREERERWFGAGPFDPTSTPIDWNADADPWVTMNNRVIGHMLEAKATDREFICMISGWCQNRIAQHFPANFAVEWGIGYEGVVPNAHWCFESHSWQHYIYGRRNVVNGRFYDVVIPNSFDPDDFEFGQGGDYLVFLGRLVERKGPHIAAQIAERLGMPLVIAGPGGTALEDGGVVSPEIAVVGENVRYVGEVGVRERAELLAGAACMIAPTIYIEPFGGVAVEAMMSGTPVVATPWGAFPETVREGVSGALFHTLPEGIAAVERALELDRSGVRDWAQRYSIWNVRHEYDRWFRRIEGLWADGSGVGDWNGEGASDLASMVAQ